MSVNDIVCKHVESRRAYMLFFHELMGYDYNECCTFKGLLCRKKCIIEGFQRFYYRGILISAVTILFHLLLMLGMRQVRSFINQYCMNI